MNQQEALAEYTTTYDVMLLHRRLGYKRLETTIRLMERHRKQ